MKGCRFVWRQGAIERELTGLLHGATAAGDLRHWWPVGSRPEQRSKNHTTVWESCTDKAWVWGTGEGVLGSLWLQESGCRCKEKAGHPPGLAHRMIAGCGGWI